MSQGTINASDIVKLTDLTDRRMRQLAAAGWFPPPDKGEYQIVPVVKGLLKYYREEANRAQKVLLDDRRLKIKKEIELLDLKIADGRNEMVPVEMVAHLWQNVTDAIRQEILASDIPRYEKERLCDHLRNIPVEEYFGEDSQESAGDTQTPTDDDAGDVGG